MQRFLLTDIAFCNSNLIYGSERLVLAALYFLCRDGERKLNYTLIEQWAGTGSRDTTRRACEKLAKKGVILIDGGVFSIVQSAQIAQKSAQNAQLDKQKSAQIAQKSAQNAQKSAQIAHPSINNINNIKEHSGGGIYREPPPPKKNFIGLTSNTQTGNAFVPPSWEEVVQVCKQKNYLPNVAQNFFAHFTAQGWKLDNGLNMCDWKAILFNWNCREQEFIARKKTNTKLPSDEEIRKQKQQQAYQQEQERERLRRQREDRPLTPEEIAANQEFIARIAARFPTNR